MSCKYSLSFLLLLIIANSTFAQLYYERDTNIIVSENNQVLNSPFIGGLNSPQFNEIDLNMDNIMDLVIFDRSGSRIMTFLNGGTANQIDYVYAPQYESAFPDIPSWIICRDYNCDGKMDLFTGVRGSSVFVYENTGTPSAGLSFQFISRVRSLYFSGQQLLNINPGASNLPGIIDHDGDGDIDFLFFAQNGAQMELHKNVSVDSTGICGLQFEQRSECWGDFTESGLNSTITLNYCRFGDDITNPERYGGSVRSLEKPISELKSDRKHAGSSVTAFDLDMSGSTDLLIGDVDSKFLTALYNDDSLAPFKNSHIGSLDSTFPSYSTPIELDLYPAAYFLDVNNDQKKDMIVSTNSNDFLTRTKYYQNVLYYENVGVNENRFIYRRDDFMQDQMIDLGRGAYPCFVDYNQDGLKDLLVGNDGYLDTALNLMVGSLALFENTGTASNPEYVLVDRDYSNLSAIPLNTISNEPQRMLAPASGDLDGDGDDDLLIGDYSGNIHYFKDNSFAGNPANYVLESAVFQSINVFGAASPAIIDVDGDNLLDMVMGYDIGFLQYYRNLGSITTPIFNLQVRTITWQGDSVLRYQLRGNPNLSHFKIGQQLDVNNALNGDNNVFQTVVAINNSAKYLDLKHPFTNSSIDDEMNTTAVIDYSEKLWGDVRLSQYHNGDNHTRPFLYRDSLNSLKLVVGSRNGYLYFFEQLDSNLYDGSFFLVDSIYANKKFGVNIGVSGADLNNDGWMDLAVGNESGGFEILTATGTYPRDSSGNPIDTAISVNEIAGIDAELKIYPNPNSNQMFIEVPQEFKTYDLRIIDLNGRTVLRNMQISQPKYRLDHDLKSGIYLVEIKSSEQRLTAKMMVKTD